MTAREEGHQHLVDDRVLADDDFANLREDPVASDRDAFGNFRETGVRGCIHQSVNV
jgi:hypothetical protein